MKLRRRAIDPTIMVIHGEFAIKIEPAASLTRFPDSVAPSSATTTLETKGASPETAPSKPTVGSVEMIPGVRSGAAGLRTLKNKTY